jgi:hypothetical protein
MAPPQGGAFDFIDVLELVDQNWWIIRIDSPTQPSPERSLLNSVFIFPALILFSGYGGNGMGWLCR